MAGDYPNVVIVFIQPTYTPMGSGTVTVQK